MRKDSQDQRREVATARALATLREVRGKIDPALLKHVAALIESAAPQVTKAGKSAPVSRSIPVDRGKMVEIARKYMELRDRKTH